MSVMSRISRHFSNIEKSSFIHRISNTCGPKIIRSIYNAANERNEYDLVVVGGGIIGAASARELILRHPKIRMAILEKEKKLAVHQSGRNSGVIHAGIYYKPGSLKAKLSVEGLCLLYGYCDDNNIPYKKSGKLIVATNAIEQKQLTDLYERAIQNEVPDLHLIKGAEAIKKVEPHCQGLVALWSPQTGIVDYASVTEHCGKDFRMAGGDIYFNFEVNGFWKSADGCYPVTITAKDGKRVKAKYVLTCGGLYSDVLAQMSGCSRDPKIIPVRGEYLLLNPDKCHLVKGNIYPVPNPRLPFLGVHFSPKMDGEVWLGPNSIPAYRREGYTWFDIKPKELIDIWLYRGFQKLMFKNCKYFTREILKSAFINMQLKDLQKYVPEITARDISRGPAGVRAQALGADGKFLDDFYFDLGKGSVQSRILHCRNAPSPGATSSLAIAKMVADRLQKEFSLDQFSA